MTVSCTTDSDPKNGGWHFTNFSEVRAFRLNWEDEQSFAKVLDGDGKLNPTRLPEEGILLTDEQVAALEAAITREHPEHPVAACFYPHHAFVFFADSGEIVGHINICFICSSYSGSPQGFAETWDLEALRALIEDLGLPLSNPDWNG